MPGWAAWRVRGASHLGLAVPGVRAAAARMRMVRAHGVQVAAECMRVVRAHVVQAAAACLCMVRVYVVQAAAAYEVKFGVQGAGLRVRGGVNMHQHAGLL